MENVTAKAINDGIEYLKDLTNENLQRMETFVADWQTAQEKSMAFASHAVDETSKRMKKNMEYGFKMTVEFQKLALASSKQAVDAFKINRD